MRKSVWMCFAASAALTLSASASVAILSSFRSGTGEDLPIAVSGPEALRRELRAAQAASLPSAVPLTVDAGWRVYTGDEGENAAALAEGLLPAESPDGGTGWPVTVREDPWTRATVFLNAAGDTIGWLSPPEGYDPEWILSETYPGGVPSWVDPRSFDPASVAVTVWLATGRDILPPAAETVPPRTGAGARAAARRPVRGGADTDGDGMPDAWETAHGRRAHPSGHPRVKSQVTAGPLGRHPSAQPTVSLSAPYPATARPTSKTATLPLFITHPPANDSFTGIKYGVHAGVLSMIRG